MKFKYLTAFFIILIINACATVPTPDIDSSGEFSYKGVPSRPGAVAWSKDSARLAVTRGNSLIIIDTESGSAEKIKGINPVFLEWSPGDDLLVITKNRESNELVKINPLDYSHSEITVKHSPASVRWFNPPEEMVVLSLDKNHMKIGTFVTFRLTRVIAGKEKEFFRKEVYFPTLNRNIDFTSGWTHPGIRPLHESVLTPVFHKPPVVAPYTNLRTVDPVTSLESNVIRFNSKRYNVPTSWSPDGSRLAITTDKGHLQIINFNNPDIRNTVNYDIQGLAPAWNPMGSQIYLGGWIINSDGPALKQLLPDASNSIGIWSPDGRKLAVISDDNIMHLKYFTPTFIAPDRPISSFLPMVHDKLRILKDLYLNRLITIDEYNEKKSKFLDYPKGVARE